ncbi:MAG: tRNA (adenosine(37)-N6)-threonylcarbamoyltransferase complex transferase subunit TsaD [Thermodesulfovibrionales bacterium]|nr:tRNA (adenosine(37)-N6)-threonylcarbamoyltransferase complex transferase subunit TsaD [Thermodesulfovibrionales bacterium]
MLCLGIDTSCDDTSAAVVLDGKRILSNIVSSQAPIHKKYGGIVPELASRRHIEMIVPVVQEALIEAKVTPKDIDFIAVCHGPGLIGSLLVGCCFAKAFSYATKIPLVAVNHLEGHIFSVFLEYNDLDFPFIAMVVSGGHTCLYLIEGFGKYIEIGRTRDDAAGEAYDKVAKILGLGYPGGPIIDKLAKEGKSNAFNFPRAYLPDTFDFSFSGIKTSIKLKFQELMSKSSDQQRGQQPENNMINNLDQQVVKDICASFQKAVIEVLVKKVEWASSKYKIKKIVLSGGVAANSELRTEMKELASSHELKLYLPSLSLCTDNAAMIAAAGFHHFLSGNLVSFDLNPKAYLPL